MNKYALSNKRYSPDNWIVADSLANRGKSGSIKTQCQLIAGEGDFRDSATENKPPYQGKGEKVR